MDKETISEILSKIESAIEDTGFYQQIFIALTKRHKRILKEKPDAIKALVAEEYGQLSYRLDESDIQESCSVRSVLKSRAIANFLIDDDGQLKLPLFPSLIQALREHLYSLDLS